MEDEILDEGVFFPKAATVENAKEILRLKADYADLHQKVRYGRNAIWWMVGLFFLGMMVEGFQYQFDPIVMGINFSAIAIMAGIGYLSYQKPFLGFLLAAIFIIFIQGMIMLGGDFVDSIRGILPRMFILYYIIVGMNAAKKYLTTLQGLKAHGVKMEA